MAKILLVDDELSIIDSLKALLSREGHDISTSSNGGDALRKLRENVFDLLITDIRLPEVDGISLLRQARELQSHLAVIVITAYAKVDNAVEAMKNGAFDYVTKPFKFDELLLTVQRALTYEQTLAENEVLKSSLDTHFHFNSLVGDSEAMRRVYKLIEKVARTNSTVLVTGSSGTGKELVAKALHTASPRFENPFVTVNCTAMPEALLESELFGHRKGAFTGATCNKKGLFEIADGGTVFLDEIGSIPLNMQMKLLRVLQEKEIRQVGSTENITIDVRVIAATNENLEEKIANREFRDDLYYRLSVIPIQMPPLAERKEDIPQLTHHFLNDFNQVNGRNVEISRSAVDLLEKCDWPGNVRELENTIKRIATLCENNRIEPCDISDNIQRHSDGDLLDDFPDIPAGKASLSLKSYLKNVELSYLKAMVDECGGNK
ncbi:MAG: sigma-54-dependent Fis family transcriptional regulator, partial [Victivallales bacterium]|nr:sigma-54-dependent Fis family transcriptional regulator [Victivallales bacterium]